MSKPDYVYVTYIATTPEKLWNALTSPEMTRQYWFNHRNASDWKPGSKWSHEDYDDASSVDVVGTILESDPPNRLVLTWADPDHANDQSKYSQVTFEITLDRGAVRLQVTHDRLESEMFRGISRGWPLVLSNLKTLLETGTTLPLGARGCANEAQPA